MDDCLNLSVISKLTTTMDSLYYVVNYNKTFLNFNDTKSGQYRSVVFSFSNKKLLSFSPPKSIPMTAFINKYPIIDKSMLITDAIEGIMISLFYDETIKKWEIATKGAVGGKYGYYGNVVKKTRELRLETPTFYRMFLDALRANPSEELNDLKLLEGLSRNACYTFILQHPKNVIVMPVKENALYLISVYVINNNTIEYISQIEYECWSCLKKFDGIIKYPKVYENISSYSDLYNFYTPGMTGVMVTNVKTGERTKCHSNKYEKLKISIKIPACSQYLYFCLRRINKVNEYLIHYPKYRKVFYKIRNEYEELITKVHNLYMETYVVGTRKPTPENSFYDNWCKKIHTELYIPCLHRRIIKPVVTRKQVKSYFDGFEPRQLLYIINNDFRQ